MTTGTENTTAKRKLAISGIKGFPGETLLQWADECLANGRGPLARRFDGIIALDIHAPQTPLKRTKFYKLDFTQPAIDQQLVDIFRQENVRSVIHLAFQLNPHHNAGYAHELHSIGTMYLLNACAKEEIDKIVVQSTTHCYGAFPNNPNFLSETHPLRGASKASYIRDRVDVEKQIQKYQKRHPECTTTVLRPCSILGPKINNFATRYLSRRACLTPMGFDPLIQLVHENDVVRAFQMAIEKDFPGVFNIVGDGVLPLLTLLRIGGRINVPVANFLLYPMVQALWQGNMAVVPPGFLDYLKYLWVADGSRAKNEMGFVPQYSTRDTMLSFIAKQRLRRVHLDN